jgi:hypothetical protein
MASDLTLETLLAMKSQTRVTYLRKPKSTKGCSANGRRIRSFIMSHYKQLYQSCEKYFSTISLFYTEK